MTFDYEWFKQKVYSMTQIDLNAYKERQMKRRIDTLIAKNKYSGYDTYVTGLTQDQSLFEEFVNYLTINVSEFYRNPEQWRLLTDEVYPMLMERFGKQLKIWSAAQQMSRIHWRCLYPSTFPSTRSASLLQI